MFQTTAGTGSSGDSIGLPFSVRGYCRATQAQPGGLAAGNVSVQLSVTTVLTHADNRIYVGSTDTSGFLEVEER